MNNIENSIQEINTAITDLQPQIGELAKSTLIAGNTAEHAQWARLETIFAEFRHQLGNAKVPAIISGV